MDELVAVHAAGESGPIASSGDGRWVHHAEGGLIALIDDDPMAAGNANYRDAHWRIPVSFYGTTPIAMAADPELVMGDGVEEEQNTILYIAAGRDGLWAMEAGREADTLSTRACRIDDSGNLDPQTQHGRKWCNDVDFMEINGTHYLLALFARVGASKLRIYKLDDVRAALSTAIGFDEAHGQEFAPQLQVNLDRSIYTASGTGGGGPPTPAAGDSYSFGMAVDYDGSDAHVFVALGEHGLIRARLREVGGVLTEVDVTDGPYFGAGSAYENRSIVQGRSLYGAVKYYEDDDPAFPPIYTHSPYFLDVAVENTTAGHRLYAAVDHLGWVAFSLDADWDNDIWTDLNPAGSPLGFPDFLQEGARVPIGSQTRDQIRLLDDTSFFTNFNHRGTSSRHLEVVTTQNGGGVPRSALVVSVSRRRFLLDPRELNEGRVLDWDLNQSVIPGAGFTPDMNGKAPYVLTYDLPGSYGDPPAWIDGGQNFTGYTRAGWELHVPEIQPDDELHFFTGGDTEQVKVDSFEFPDDAFDRNHFMRAWYSTWPTAIGSPPGHDGFRSRDRFHDLGRITVSAFPSKVDPRLILTSSNDAGVVPDGDPVFTYNSSTGRGTIKTPNAKKGARLIPAGDPLYPEGSLQPALRTRQLNLGVATAPGGGWAKSDGTHLWEYRAGWSPRSLGASHDPGNINAAASEIYAVRMTLHKFRPLIDPSTLEIGDVQVINRLHVTPPACKFSPLPYSDPTIGSPPAGKSFREYYQNQWYGRLYYSEPETFGAYNEYVKANYSTTDSEGIFFSILNGSPQGIWAYGMSEIQAKLDNASGATSKDSRLESVVRPIAAADEEISALGGLVTHPEYWNVPDVRTATYGSTMFESGELFLQGFVGNGVPQGAAGGTAAVHTWDVDMGQLPNPDYDPESDPPHLEKKWMMAAACGFIVLKQDDPALTDPNWKPDSEFIDGHHHMLVRIFDMSDPELLVGAIALSGSPALFENDDSRDLSADTIIGPDAETSANFVKFIHTKDELGLDRDLLLVADLGGKIYLYDLDGVLDSPNPNIHSAERAGAHFGSFFKTSADPALGQTYEVHGSLSDDFHGGVYGVEVAQEAWLDSMSVPQEATYVYVGVPRLGVEVLELEFEADQVTPVLKYVGRIQTPGNATRLHIERYDSGSEFPEALLFVADYNGRYRIYKNPGSSGGL